MDPPHTPTTRPPEGRLTENTFRLASRADWEKMAKDLRPVATAANKSDAKAKLDGCAPLDEPLEASTPPSPSHSATVTRQDTPDSRDIRSTRHHVGARGWVNLRRTVPMKW